MTGRAITFGTRRALATTVAAFIAIGGVEVYQTNQVGDTLALSADNASALEDVIRTTRSIETVVKPVCITPGTKDDCRRILIAADESRVLGLCRLTTEVLGKAGIEVRCVVSGSSVPPPSDTRQRQQNG